MDMKQILDSLERPVTVRAFRFAIALDGPVAVEMEWNDEDDQWDMSFAGSMASDHDVLVTYLSGELGSDNVHGRHTDRHEILCAARDDEALLRVADLLHKLETTPFRDHDGGNPVTGGAAQDEKSKNIKAADGIDDTPKQLQSGYIDKVAGYLGLRPDPSPLPGARWNMWTVFYRYVDDGGTGYAHVQAATPAEAVIRAVLFQELDVENGTAVEERAKRDAMFCIPGWHRDVLEWDCPVDGTAIADIDNADDAD